jgi:hypothetical protein
MSREDPRHQSLARIKHIKSQQNNHHVPILQRQKNLTLFRLILDDQNMLQNGDTCTRSLLWVKDEIDAFVDTMRE